MKLSMRMTMVALIMLLAVSAVTSADEWQWEKFGPVWPEGRANFAWAWDDERNIAVMFDGSGWVETREWDGVRWSAGYGELAGV